MIYAAEAIKGLGTCEAVSIHATFEGARRAVERHFGRGDGQGRLEWEEVVPGSLAYATVGEQYVGRIRGFDLQV